MIETTIAIEPAMLTSEAAARLLSISERHFLNMNKDGRLGPKAVRLGGSVRWLKEELIEWLKGGCAGRSEWEKLDHRAKVSST